ncbi:MAG: choice-of-anchor tandem repeat GloVer-containing protein, partial [archaeon]
VSTGYIFTSTDSGASWTQQTASGSNAWSSITSSYDGTKLAATVSTGYIFTSTDSGASWTQQTASGSNAWSSIAISSNGGRLVAAVNSGYIYALTYSGSAWNWWGQQISIGSPSFYNLTLSLGGTKILGETLTVTNTLTISAGIFDTSSSNYTVNAGKITINGGTFTPNTSTVNMTGTSGTLFTLSSGLFTAGTSTVNLSGNSGDGWVERTSSGSRYWQSMASSSDGVKLVAGVYPGYIYTSTDSGVNWTERTGPGSQGWNGFASSSDGTKLVAVPYNGYIYTSIDSGATWTQQTASGQRIWTEVASSSDGTKLVAVVGGAYGTGYIFTSTDSGASWTQRTTAGARPWTDVASSSDGTKLVAVVGSYSNGYIYTSTDSGASWNQRDSTRNWASVASSSDGVKLVATAYGGYIYTSTDSGANWTARTGPGSGGWWPVVSSSDGTVISVCYNGGYLYTSFDSGVSWFSEGGSISTNWRGLAGSSDGMKLFSGSSSGSYIYTYTMPAIINSGSPSFYNLTSSGTGKKVMGANFTVSNVFNITGGNFSGSSYVLTLSGTTGTPFPSPSGSGIFSAGTGTVTYSGNYSGGNTTIESSVTYYNLTLNNSSETFNPNNTINGNVAGTLTVTSGILNTTANNYAINFGKLDISGTLTANVSVITLNAVSGTLFTKAGTFTQGTSEVKITSAITGALTLLSAATTFHKLTINTTGTYPVNAGKVITMSNADASNKLYIKTGVLNDGGNTIVGTANGTLVLDAGTALCISGTAAGTNLTCDSGAVPTTASTFPTNYINGNITFNITSTVYYNANATATISNVPTYSNLYLKPLITAARAFTFGGATAINGDFTINPGTTAYLLTVNMGGDITVASGKTTTITRTTSATSLLDTRPSSTDYNLSTGYLNIATGGTLDCTSSASNVTLTGTSGTLFTLVGTYTITSGTPTITISGNGDAIINTSTITFYNLTSSGSGIKSLGTTITVNNNFTISGGTFDDNGYQITGNATGTLSIASGKNLNLGGLIFTKKIDLPTSSAPYGSMTLGSDGKFYGMTYFGGGYIFQYDSATNGFTKKYTFDGTNGSNPLGALTLGTDGKYYGVTYGGGANSVGVIFQYDSAINTYTKKIDLSTANGSVGIGSLILANDGKFYGMTRSGGVNNLGVIFQYDFATNTYTKKIDLSTANGNNTYESLGSLTLGTDGKLYGMTTDGGASTCGGSKCGALFQYDPATNIYTKKVDFDFTKGRTPMGSLTLGSDGKFYGMTSAGGANSVGVIFQYDSATNSYTKKIDFDGTNGSSPQGALTLGSDGKFYGMTRIGGANSVGVIFQYDSATNTYTKKVDLDTTNGKNPYGSLTLNTDGKLYGMTYGGGANTNGGVIFSYEGSNTLFPTNFTNAHISLNSASNVVFNGLSQTISSAPTYGNLKISNGGTKILGGDVSIAGVLTIDANTTLDANSRTVTLSGSTGTLFSNSGTYTAGTSTIKFTDTGNSAITFAGGGGTFNNIWFARGTSTASNTISGNNTFKDFKDNGSIAHSILFTTGSTQHVTTFTVSGTAGNLISINSTDTGTHALVKDGGGTISSDYLNIQHSVATPSSTWYAGLNSTNNQSVSTSGSGWIFTGIPISISGTANGNNGGTVKVAVNGTLQAQTGTIGSSTWTITGVTQPTANDIVTVWVDGATDANETTGVTKYSSGSITGMVLNTGVLSIGSNQNTSLTLTNLGLYDADNNEDVMHTANSSVLLTQGATNSYTNPTLSILASNTLTIGNTESATAGLLNIAGTLTSTGNASYTLNGTSGTLFTLSGTFTQGTSTINLSGNGDATINSGSPTFYNLTSSGSGIKSVGAAITVASSGTLAISAGTFAPTTYLITASGTNTLSVANGATIRVGASTFAGNYSAGFTTVTLTSGSTVDYYLNGTQTVSSTISPYSNLTVSTGGTKTLGGDLTVGNVMTIGTGATLDASSYTMTLSGTTGTPFVKTGTFTPSTGTVSYTGNYTSGNTNVVATTYNNLILNNASETYILAGDITVGNVLTITAGTLDGSSRTITLSGTTGTPFVKTGTFTASTGTVSYTGNYTSGNTNVVATTYNNLILNNASETYILAGDVTASGVLTITAGTLDGSSRTITLSGTTGTPFVATGTFTANTSTVLYTGNNSGGNTIIANVTYNNLTVNNASETFNFSANATINGTLTVTAGTLDTAGTAGGSFNTSATSPRTMADDATVGGVTWSNPDNAKVSDNAYTTASFTNINTISHYIKATDFGFSVPSGATINGILVEIEKGMDTNSVIKDNLIKIVKADGSIGTVNKAYVGTIWPTGDTYSSYGSSSDLWGETWDSTKINDLDFGIAISAIAEIGGGGGASLNENSLISTPSGDIKIKDLKTGDEVYSYSENNIVEVKKIERVWSVPISNDNNRYFVIHFNGKTIQATENHKFYLNGIYVRADELKVGDKLLGLDLNEYPIEKIKVIENTTDFVWDLSIKDNHNFFANNILTHNFSYGNGRIDHIRTTIYYTTVASGDFNISAGNISIGASGTLKANSSTITDSGNWTNSGGTFTAGTSNVILNTGTTASVGGGATTFYDLTITHSGVKEVDFSNTAGHIVTVAHAFTVNGNESNLIKLYSASAGNKWHFLPSGTATVDYADVKDGGCESGAITISPTHSTDSGNNDSCWSFYVPAITFGMSNNNADLGVLTPTQSQYATAGAGSGGSTSQVEAHNFTVTDNSPSGYTVSVIGASLTDIISGHIISPIGGSNTAPNPGHEQFGLRIDASGGTGAVTSPYDGSGFAYGADETTASQVASATSGDGITTTYSVRYLSNVSPTTNAGNYNATIKYLVTGNF